MANHGWAGTPLNLPKYVLCRPTKLGADRDKIMSVRPIFTVRTALWNHLVQRQEIHFHLTIKNARREISCAVGVSAVIVFRDEICARNAFMLFAVRCSLFAVRCSLFAVRCSLFAVRCSLFAVRCSRKIVSAVSCVSSGFACF